MVRVILLHFDAFLVHFDKLIPRGGGGGAGQLKKHPVSQNLYDSMDTVMQLERRRDTLFFQASNVMRSLFSECAIFRSSSTQKVRS